MRPAGYPRKVWWRTPRKRRNREMRMWRRYEAMLAAAVECSEVPW